MRPYPFASPAKLVIFSAAIGAFFLPSLGRAQSAQTYDGGTGQWDAGTTKDWDGGADAWTNGNNAYFTAPTDTVTVSGTVESNYMEFDGGVTSATISGGTIDQLPVTAYDPTLINDFAGGPVSVSSQIELSDMGSGNEQTFVNNYSNYNLELGNIDFGAYTLQPTRTTDRRVNIYSSGPGGSVTLNGNYTDSSSYGYGQLNFNGNGSATAAGASVFNITSSANFSSFTNGQLNDYNGGIINLNNDTILPGVILSATDADAFNEINIIGSHTGANSINAGLYDSTKNSGSTRDIYGVSTYGVEHLNQSTADVTTWVGHINMDGSNLDLSAVSGGRLIIDDLGGNTPDGLVVSGNGVVVLANPNGNGYNEEEGQGYVLPTSTVAADLQSGTTLISNTAGGGGSGAFGPNVSYGRDGTQSANHVNIEGGATLGGSGFVTQQVYALGVVGTTGASILAPGDPGDSAHGIAASIGTLTFTGGLEADNGLTMNFKLSGGGTAPGENSDSIVMSSFTLSGPLTINLSALGTLPLMTGAGNEYILFQDNNADPINTSEFTVLAPTGYALDPTYGLSDGTDDGKSLGYDYEGGVFTVELVAIPEPSTYGLIGLSLLALVAIGRFRSRTA